MKAFLGVVKKIDIYLNSIAEIILVSMVLLTVMDILFRLFGKSAIMGTFELVGVMGGIVIAFSLPRTSWDRGHVFVDLLIENRSAVAKNTIFVITRIVGIIIMAFVAWNLMKKGMHLKEAGEVSMTLHLPYFPWSFAFGACFLIESITLLADIFRIFDSGEEK
jgi:TRAP-type C4-dicarboxylate transport system permease small subunit